MAVTGDCEGGGIWLPDLGDGFFWSWVLAPAPVNRKTDTPLFFQGREAVQLKYQKLEIA